MIWENDKDGFRMGDFGFWARPLLLTESKNTKFRLLKNRHGEVSGKRRHKSLWKSIEFSFLFFKKIA